MSTERIRMAVIRSKLNQCVAEVDDVLAEKLIADGGWEATDTPARKRRVLKPVSAEETQE